MYKTALCFDFPEVDMEGLKKQVSKCNISMHFLLYSGNQKKEFYFS